MQFMASPLRLLLCSDFLGFFANTHNILYQLGSGQLFPNCNLRIAHIPLERIFNGHECFTIGADHGLAQPRNQSNDIINIGKRYYCSTPCFTPGSFTSICFNSQFPNPLDYGIQHGSSEAEESNSNHRFHAAQNMHTVRSG